MQDAVDLGAQPIDAFSLVKIWFAHSASFASMKRRNLSLSKVQTFPILAAPGNWPLAAMDWTPRAVMPSISAASIVRILVMLLSS
ncbi:MAG TPA: hypothetical protein VIF34_07380 [Methylocystis sp.]